MEKNKTREEFIKKYKVEGINISKYPQEIDRFFTHKFENMQGALDGIIFYTNYEIHQKERLSDAYKMTTEEKIKRLVKDTLENYIHFLRFTERLDNSNIEDDYYNLKNGNKVYDQFNKEEIREKVQNRIKELIKKQKIQIMKVGLYFTSEEEAYYKKEYSYQTNLQECNSAWWTEDLFSAIKYLKELEKTDESNYYETWMHCKIEREKNRQNNIEKRDANIKIL